MLKSLAAEEPLVKSTFDEADRVMEPLLGRPLSSYIFIDGDDPAAVRTLNQQLMQTEITQPAVLATDIALTRLLAAYGVQPDMVMGHSLGEYGALVAAGALTLDSALEAVSARGREMTKVSVADNGAMAAVFAPMAEIQRVVDQADGYVVIANINSTSQAVVGGATDAVERIIERFTAEGFTATRIPVSHAFHTSIVAPASGPFVDALRRLDLRPPTKPVVANVTGDFYPQGATAETVLEYAGRQIASPVQFVKGLQTLYAAGARVFVEVGPKKALHGFVEDVLGSEHDDVVALFTNHPKVGDDVAFNQALCGLYAAGIGLDRHETPQVPVGSAATTATTAPARTQTASGPDAPADATIRELGLLFADVLEKGMHLYAGTGAAGQPSAPPTPVPAPEPARPTGPPALEPVVISGAALGLPGTEQTFDDDNVAKILAGQNFISVLGEDTRRRMVDMRITRLVKDAASGGGSFATIDDPQDVIKLAGRARTPRRRGAVRGRQGPRRGPRHHDAVGDRGGVRCDARRRHPARHELQDHDAGHPAARPLGAAGGAARRDRCHLRLGLPRLRPLRRGRRGLRARPWPPRGPAGRRGAARPDGRGRPGHDRGRCARRRDARDPRARALPVRPAFPLPGPVDGPLPVRGDHRGTRPEHTGQRRVREHHPGPVPGRGLDPRGTVPQGRRRLRGRRHR